VWKLAGGFQLISSLIAIDMSLQNRPVTFNDTKSVILALCPGKEAWVTLH